MPISLHGRRTVVSGLGKRFAYAKTGPKKETSSPKVAAVGIDYGGRVDRPCSERLNHETLAGTNNVLIRNRYRYIYSHTDSHELRAQIVTLEDHRLR
jgi:hypothetical protein